jgi:hypothetical protein
MILLKCRCCVIKENFIALDDVAASLFSLMWNGGLLTQKSGVSAEPVPMLSLADDNIPVYPEARLVISS